MNRKRIKVIIATFLILVLTFMIPQNYVAAASQSNSTTDKIENLFISGIPYSTYTMKKGETKQLKLTAESKKVPTVIWSSSNKAVVSVTRKGKITAKKNGKAIITAKTTDGKKAVKLTITVGIPSKGISVSQTKIALYSGTKKKLNASLLPQKVSNSQLAYQTSDTSVVKVNSNGTITAQKAGTAVIYILSKDGRSKKTIKVTVKPQPKPLIITQEQLKENLYTIENRSYKEVHVIPSGEETTISISNSDIKKLILDSENSCSIDIKESKIDTMAVERQDTLTPMEAQEKDAYSDNNIKKVQLDSNSSIQNAFVMGTIEIEGEGNLKKVTVEETGMIRLNAATEEIEILPGAAGSSIEIYEPVKTIKNSAEESTIQIDSEIEEFSNTGKKANIIVNQKGQISTLTTEGAYSSISGLGQVEQMNVYGNYNTIDLTCKNVTVDENVKGIIDKNHSDASDKDKENKEESPNKEEIKEGETSSKEDTEKDTENSNTSSGTGSSDNNITDTMPVPPVSEKLEIKTLESVENGRVKMTLSKDPGYFLELKDFVIYCPAGRKMTILKVNPISSTVYELITAYYADDIYTLIVTLKDQSTLEKTFVSKYDCPNVSGQEVKRLSDTYAKVTFYSDERGIVYYMMMERPNLKIASFSAEKSKESPIWSEIKENALENKTYQVMENGKNTIDLTELKKDTIYDFYFVLESTDGRISKEITLSIPLKQGTDPSVIEIIEAKAKSSNQIQITFNKKIEEVLTKDNFQITCPSGELHLGKIETEDQTTFIVNSQEGYGFYDRNTYQILVTFADGTTVNGSFHSDYSAPAFTNFKWTRYEKNITTLTFECDKPGLVYYTTSVAEYHLKPKMEEMLQLSPVVIKQGVNSISFDSSAYKDGEEYFFCYVTENADRYRMAYVGSTRIEGVITDKPGEDIESTIYQINSVNVSTIKHFVTNKDVTYLSLTFNTLNGITGISNNDIQLLDEDGLNIMTTADYKGLYIYPIQNNEMYMDFIRKLEAGKYTLKIQFQLNGKTELVKTEIVIE